MLPSHVQCNNNFLSFIIAKSKLLDDINICNPLYGKTDSMMYDNEQNKSTTSLAFKKSGRKCRLGQFYNTPNMCERREKFRDFFPTSITRDILHLCQF